MLNYERQDFKLINSLELCKFIDLLFDFSPPNCISNFINIVECTNLKATISNYDEIKAKQNGLYTLKEKGFIP